MTKFDALLIAGPTASGKSALALEIAAALGGVIINADSMQVYDGLEILSAAPSQEDKAIVPHRLFGIVEPGASFSVAEWHRRASSEIFDCRKAGKLPILVGGTGLYFKTLLGGLAAIPEIPAKIRDAVRRRLRDQGPEALHCQLADVDPKSAERLGENDSQRICRALEVLEATGRSLQDWQQKSQDGALQGPDERGQVMKLVLDLPRELLYLRINQRFLTMIAAGGLEEAGNMRERQALIGSPAFKALGLRSLIDHMEGRLSLDLAIEEAQKLTRRYAKRQLTWFRNQFADWWWLDGQDQKIIQAVLNRMKNGKSGHAGL